jgi:hypothetical protein
MRATWVLTVPSQAALVDFLDRQQAVMTPVVLPLLIAVSVAVPDPAVSGRLS